LVVSNAEEFRGQVLSNGRSIPSLDGLRAVAVIFVILGHCEATVLDRVPLLYLVRDGILGVNMFFVISGFLITYLLLKEQNRGGGIDAKQFYVRRAFRIFPPFYFFLFVVTILKIGHVYNFTWPSLVSAATYTWNYNPHADGWILGHTWSLSLEEQFYLLWPTCLIFFSRRSCLKLALGLIVLSPFSRLITYALYPALRGRIIMMLHTHIDAIMVGCVIALALEMHLMRKLFARLSRPGWAVPSAIYLFIVAPLLEKRFRGSYELPIGMTLTSLCCGIILIYAVKNPESSLGRLLNLPWLRHIGVISYSLYLWQQMFSGPATRFFPINLLLILVCAEASYWLVERPSLKVRDMLLAPRIFPSRDHEGPLHLQQQDLTIK
jgi:peptidoglycan/LPS O-acetylase OafA/YrhL